VFVSSKRQNNCVLHDLLFNYLINEVW